MGHIEPESSSLRRFPSEKNINNVYLISIDKSTKVKIYTKLVGKGEKERGNMVNKV